MHPTRSGLVRVTEELENVSADGSSLPVPIFVIGIAISAVLWALFFVWFMKRRNLVLFPKETESSEEVEAAVVAPSQREIRIPDQYK